MGKKILLGALWALLAPHALQAQKVSKCGDLPEVPGDVAQYRSFLSDPEFQWLRDANGFETLAPDAPGIRVTDDHECTPIRVALQRHVRETLRGTPEGRQALRDGYRYMVYRIGPYYIVPVAPTDADGAIVEGYAVVNVFRVDSLEFVGDFLH